MQDIRTLDLRFQGIHGLISAFLVPDGDGGFVLLETGPASCLEALERGVEQEGHQMDQLRGVFVTHVHLDHSGAAGALSRRTGCPVFVHPEGRDHLVDPEAKLLPSAERLYGDRMQRLWGTTEGVPSDAATPVDDDQSVRIGELRMRALHTPGHARHHVAWQVGSAVATGDVAGVRFPPAGHVLPPTPPPDIDLEAWQTSVDRLRRLRPERLLLTHYGVVDDVQEHLSQLRDRLRRWGELALQVVDEGGGIDELATRLLNVDRQELAGTGAPEDAVLRYRELCPMHGNAAGMHRWARTRHAPAG